MDHSPSIAAIQFPVWRAIVLRNQEWKNRRDATRCRVPIQYAGVWNSCVGIADESDYRLGGSFFDGKGQPRKAVLFLMDHPRHVQWS